MSPWHRKIKNQEFKMDLDIKLKPPPAGDVLHKSIVIPSPARQNRLPPIPSQSSSTDDHIDQLSGILLEQSKGDVEEAMKHLLSEVLSSTECFIMNKKSFLNLGRIS